jgi:hypothetical protein
LPQDLRPGNRMPHAGMANAGDRADLIAYLIKAAIGLGEGGCSSENTSDEVSDQAAAD